MGGTGLGMNSAGVTMLSYGLLYLAVLSLWLPYKIGNLPMWSVAAGSACCLALLNQQIDALGIFPLTAFAYALYYRGKLDAPKGGILLGNGAVLVLAYALGAHLIPYFHNVRVLSEVIISKGGVPFTLYLNFDKALVGLFILGITHQLARTGRQWRELFRKSMYLVVLTVVMVIVPAWMAGKVYFEPKLPDCLPIWLVNNLLFVCMAEEAFFRGFVQKNLVAALREYPGGTGSAILLASLLFGFAHYGGGIAYSIWGTLAGFGYGWLYHKTGYIEASILGHFSLNAIHFMLFTYPAVGKLAQG